MLNIPCTLPVHRERAYLVGGSVRDLLMERKPEDYDIVVAGDPESYARRLAALHRTRPIPLGKAEKSIFHVQGRDAAYDISRLKGNAIETDLMQRDFTVNALACDIGTGDIIDVTHGRRDLLAGRVRMVSPAIFDQDPVRLLRGFRLAAQLGFSIEEKTAATIRKKKHLIKSAAGERIRHEWLGILNQPSTKASLANMAATGMLTALFPELADLAGLHQNRHHEFDALTHSLKTVEHLETYFDSLEGPFTQTAATLNSVLNQQRRTMLKCAALLHDTGKPAALSTDEKGRRRYYGHEKISARLAERISRRFRLSNRERESIVMIVRQHLRPLFLFNREGQKSTRNRAQARFFLACGGRVPEVVLHAVADSRAKTAGACRRHSTFERFADNLLQDYFAGFQAKKMAPPLVGGRDLIREFGLSPSPVFSVVLKRVEEARLAGDINTRDQALNFAEQVLNRIDADHEKASSKRASRPAKTRTPSKDK